MAAIDTRTASAKSGFSVVSLIATFAAWNDARKTRTSLSKLSARELDDIGLTFSDIESVCKGKKTR